MHVGISSYFLSAASRVVGQRDIVEVKYAEKVSKRKKRSYCSKERYAYPSARRVCGSHDIHGTARQKIKERTNTRLGSVRRPLSSTSVFADEDTLRCSADFHRTERGRDKAIVAEAACRADR